MPPREPHQAPGAPDNGCPPDFSEVYRSHAAQVSLWARRLGGPEIDVEDVTQEVFTVFLRRLDAYDPQRAEIGAYLHGITVRVVQALRRRQRVRRWLGKLWGGERSEHDPVDDQPNPERQLQRQQARALLYGLLEQVPDAQRTAFVLYEIEELDGASIAALTGTSVANVWVRVHRARRTLENLAERHEAALLPMPRQAKPALSKGVK
ncbi:MAG: sigma-70 family RNA polymerase sigma factor [Myxococcales bacterium]|nr:sigma-70 family RNA polymerase sigma factor [Myxococcales bacterium]